MDRPVIIGASGDVRAICLAVHGRGQDPADMQRMVIDHLRLPGLRWVMPVAEGRSWYTARAVDPLSPETQAQMAVGHAAFDALMAAERAAHPGVPVVAAGFSQGACMVAEWVLRGAAVDALAVFTGCRVGAPDPALPTRPLGGLPVYASCGDADSWIPLPDFMALGTTLAAQGARVRLDVFPGRPHDICPSEVAEFGQMLAALTEGRPVMAEGMP
jgi:phospholipase/carboxylesterase